MKSADLLQAAPGRVGEWTPDPGFGVYVHIPFCRHRCHYCDFNTYEGQDSIHGAYVDALVRHIERDEDGAGRGPATSVFFGGGTPTMVPPADLARVLEAVRTRIGIAPDAEITVEANPETVDEQAFEGLLAAGFTRVSIGVQSLVPHVLLGLGRTHSPDVALCAIAAARRAGFDDINADLIYGSQWESTEDWLDSLDGTIAAGPDHVSAYALTIEAGTPLATLVSTGRIADVDPDIQAERHAMACEVMGAAGLIRYEVSNWTRPGRASRHNVLYWCAGDYLGFGAGAHGHIAGRRSWSVRLPREFVSRVAAGESTEAGSEKLDEDARAGEALMLGLRLASGIDLARFIARFGHSALAARRPAIEDLAARGLLDTGSGRLRIPEVHTLVSNEVAAALL
jgi:putative oxygen-independent coproporphyrinogen III oxidase